MTLESQSERAVAVTKEAEGNAEKPPKSQGAGQADRGVRKWSRRYCDRGLEPEHRREGLPHGPRFPEGAISLRSSWPLMFQNERSVLIRFYDIPSKSPLEQVRPARLVEDIELALADQPVLRVGLIELTPG